MQSLGMIGTTMTMIGEGGVVQSLGMNRSQDCHRGIRAGGRGAVNGRVRVGAWIRGCEQPPPIQPSFIVSPHCSNSRALSLALIALSLISSILSALILIRNYSTARTCR